MNKNINVNLLVRPNILNLKPYSSARGENTQGVLLDANENAFGSVVEELEVDNLNRYPDPNQLEVRKKLSKYLGIPFKNLFCGVGSDEIIDLIIRIFCEPAKDAAIILEPTYGMYEVACSINNVNIWQVMLKNDFQIDIVKTLSVQDKNSKILFLCSPNNPTGGLLNKNDILSIARGFDGIVIVDEAYIEFNESGSVISEINNFNNLIVLRTFSKAWGLAGVRFGYCAASEDIIKLLFKIKAPYNLNKLTAGAILKALDNKEKKEKFVSIINEEKARVSEKLASFEGIEKIYDSDSNFILFKCRDSKLIMEYLLDKGIVIRDRSKHPMLSNCLRLTIGTRQENDLFLTAVWRALCEVYS